MLQAAATQCGMGNVLAGLVGAATLASGLLARRIWPKVPYMIVAMVVGGLLAALLKHTMPEAAAAIRTVGALPQVIPQLSMPDLSPASLRALLFPAAVVAVIGGANLAGGIGGAAGAIIGCILIEVIRNGLVLARVDPYWQQTLVGCIIVAAVLVDRLRSLRNG